MATALTAKNLNIKWKLFLYLSIFAFLMLIVLWVFQTVLLDRFYKAAKTRQISGVAKLIKKNIDSENLDELVERINFEDNYINILIYNEDGEVIYTPARFLGAAVTRIEPARPAEPFKPSAPVSPEQNGQHIVDLIGRAKESGNASFIGIEQGGAALQIYNPEQFGGRVPPARLRKMETITHIEHAVNNGGENVYILISALITPLNATVMTIRYQLIYITVILLLFALVLSLYFSRKFAKPIMEINESAKELAAGNYGARFNAEGYREINELNETLNNAAYELSRVESLRRELLANVSHDLRTPLTMITGFGEMIRDLPGENTPENAQVIVDESNRLTRLVSDLLNISRLESGNMEMETETSVFCITDTLKDTIARMSAAFTDGRRIIFEPDTDVSVNANESQIIQVIYNLIANALNYSDGDVTVAQQLNKKTVRVEVRDKGQGIPKADLPYVWDRYYKAAGPHKRANIGTGLGLSIVRGVIERHGGTCGALSEWGEGSAFWFELEVCE